MINFLAQKVLENRMQNTTHSYFFPVQVIFRQVTFLVLLHFSNFAVVRQTFVFAKLWIKRCGTIKFWKIKIGNLFLLIEQAFWTSKALGSVRHGR